MSVSFALLDGDCRKGGGGNATARRGMGGVSFALLDGWQVTREDERRVITRASGRRAGVWGLGWFGAVTEGAEAVTGGAEAVTEGAEAVTEGAEAVTGGAEAVTGGAEAVTGGAQAVTGGAEARRRQAAMSRLSLLEPSLVYTFIN